MVVHFIFQLLGGFKLTMRTFPTYKSIVRWLSSLLHICNFVLNYPDSVTSELTVEVKSFFCFIINVNFLQNLFGCVKVYISAMLLYELLKDRLPLFVLRFWTVDFLFHVWELERFFWVTWVKTLISKYNLLEWKLWILSRWWNFLCFLLFLLLNCNFGYVLVAFFQL